MTIVDVKGAEFSDCGRYRYRLWRNWSAFGRVVAFIGLNPSTADAEKDDPTIRRCIGFAKAWGFDGLVMLNAFAFRATDPAVLLHQQKPNGDGNNLAIRTACEHAAAVIAAWGVHCPINRAEAVCQLVNRPIHCLGRTKDGHPRHPLYVKGDTPRELFWSPGPESRP